MVPSSERSNDLASIDVRSNDLDAAIENYRWLLPSWLRAGLQSPFWTGMRAVVELLMRSGEAIAAIRLLGAVMAPGAGHDVYGDDAARPDSLHAELEEQAGRKRFHEDSLPGPGSTKRPPPGRRRPHSTD